MGLIKGFVEGGLASIVAGCSTHPLDLIKVRMQLQGGPAALAQQPLAPMNMPQLSVASSLTCNGGGSHNFTINIRPAAAGVAPAQYLAPAAASTSRSGPIAVGVTIARAEGLGALFSGVSATVLRQSLYSTTRMGLYEVLKAKWSSTEGSSGNKSGDVDRQLPAVKKVAAGLVAGGIGAAVGNPADVAMVRMQADGRLPPHQRRNYSSVTDALLRMVRQEGVAGLWRGSSLTIQRAMVVTASQLATYDQAKESLVKGRTAMKEDSLATHVAASCAAGGVAALASNPIDVIKTRIMNMEPTTTSNGQVHVPYKGALDCALKTVQAEGPMALYKGFLPTVMRQAPFTVVLFVTLEQIRHLSNHF